LSGSALLYRLQRDLKQVSRFAALGVLMVIVISAVSAVEFSAPASFAQVSETGVEGVLVMNLRQLVPCRGREIVTYLIPDFFGFRRANHYEMNRCACVPYWGRIAFHANRTLFRNLTLLFVVLALCFVRNKHILTLGVIAL
jgi:hypothetical protein